MKARQPTVAAEIGRTRHRSGWAARCLLAVCVVLCGVGEAETVPQVYAIDLPALPLAQALNALSEQTGMPVLFSYDLVKSREGRTVVGTYTLPRALDILLQGSGLSGDLSDKGVLTISPTGSEARHSNNTGETGVSSKQVGQDHGNRWQSWVAALGTFIASLGGTSVAHAQEAQDEGKLEEIVVTAQRREESLDKVPISVTAFSQKTMDELHIQSFSDLASIVPGLVIPVPGAGVAQSDNDIAIRGIFSGGNAATTGIYIDETPITVRQNTAAGFSGSPRPDIFDLDRIEVLRGPQGTLFGSGAMGGAIRFLTPQPSVRDSSGYAKLEVGYTDRGAPSYAVGVAYGAPIVTGTAGFRVSGWFHSDGGFIDIEDPYSGKILKRNANSSQSYTLRPAFTLVPMDGLTITPAVFLQHHTSDEPPEYWVTDVVSPEKGAHVSGFGANVPQGVRDDLTVPSLTIKYDFPGMSLQSDTSYVDRSFNDYDDWSHYLGAFFGAPPVDPSLASFSAYDQNINWTKAFQQEFRLSSQEPGSRWSWIVGAYYRHAVDGVEQVIAPDLTPVTELIANQTSLEFFGFPNYVIDGKEYNSYSRFTTVTEQKALFGEITVNILPRLKANAGVRIERTAVVQQDEQYGGALQGVTYAHLVLPDQVQTPITPRFGLTYQYTDQDMVYATAAKGYRTGGSNSPNAAEPLCQPSLTALGLTSAPATYNSDSLWSYEVGAKDTLLEQRLSLQASAYYIDWTNIQTQVNLISCGAFYTANRGKAVSRGFDLQIAGVLPGGVRVSGNVGYTDAYYPDAMNGATLNGVTPQLHGAGEKLTQVLPWTASVHVDYSRDISRLWQSALSYVRVDYRWLDGAPKANPNDVNYDPAVGPFPDQAYGVLNLRLGVIHGRLDLSAYVNNVTNSDPLLQYNHAHIGDSLYSATAIPPLTAGLTALYRF